MRKDPVVEEMRVHSAKMAEECNFDVSRFGELLRTREAASARTFASEAVGNPILTVAELLKGLSGEPVAESLATPQAVFLSSILLALATLGGQSSRSEVTAEIERMIGDRLTAADRGPQKDGGIRWQQNVEFAKSDLVNLGLLVRNAPREPWALSEAGWRVVRDLATSRVA